MSLRLSVREVSRALQRALVPGLRYSQTYFEKYVRRHIRQRAPRVEAWLDLGCGHAIFPPWRGKWERALVESLPLVVGVDYDLDALRKHRSMRNLVRADARRLPFADASFDLVTANMVVEHLDDPAREFAEIGRVLRPGGTFVFHTPNERSYVVRMARQVPDPVRRRLVKLLDGRDAADVFPTFYRANRPEAVAALAPRAGLELADLTLISSFPLTTDLPPVAALELLFIRVLNRPRFARYRTNMIVTLRKPSDVPAGVPAGQGA